MRFLGNIKNKLQFIIILMSIYVIIKYGSKFTLNLNSSTPPKCSFRTDLEPQGKNLLNIYSYPHNYITTCENKCKNEEMLDIIFLIKSCHKHLAHRNAIRETWVVQGRFPDVKFRHVFLMGVENSNDSVRVETLKEQEQFGDIVMADFEDAFWNSSLKCILGIQWARKYCTNSKFFIIADDDTYISFKHMMTYLKNIYDPRVALANCYLSHELDSSCLELQFYGGYVIRNPPVVRSPDNHLYVSPEEFPYSYYPDTINGHTIVMTRNVIDNFYYAAHFTKFFRIDDVYIALLAERANIKPIHMPQVFHWPPGDLYNLDLFNDIISVHKIEPEHLLRIHKAQVERGNA